MMTSLIELHPIFANSVPSEDPDPVQCVIHNAFLESIRQADEEEAAQLLSEYSASAKKMGRSLGDEDVAMTDIPSTYTEASYSSTGSEVFSDFTEAHYTDNPGSFSECYDMIENMLTVDMDIITSCIIENDSQCSLPSLTDDASDSDESTDSDLDISAPAPLSISPRVTPEPQPLTVAIIPQPTNSESPLIPHTPRLRPRTFTNPLPAFLSNRLIPTLASPKLNTQLTTIPKKRVHFHPNTSTRSFVSTSYASDFETSTFSPVQPPSPVNAITIRRQRKKARLHGSTSRSRRDQPRDRKEQGLRTFPRTCVATFLAAQHLPSLPSHTEHQSIQSAYTTLLSRLAAMHSTFQTSLATASASASAAPTLLKAKHLHLALKEDLQDYLTKYRYLGRSAQQDNQKMSTCPDTCDAETFEETAQIFGRCLEKLLLDYWSGEREMAEKEIEELLVDGCVSSELAGEERMVDQM